MDSALLRISRGYERRNRGRSEEEAREELLEVYEAYTGEKLEVALEEPGWAERGMASAAGLAVRTALGALGLGPLRRPAGFLAKQGVRHSQEASKLVNAVRANRKALERVARPERTVRPPRPGRAERSARPQWQLR